MKRYPVTHMLIKIARLTAALIFRIPHPNLCTRSILLISIGPSLKIKKKGSKKGLQKSPPKVEENAPDNAEGTSTLLDKLDTDGDGVVSFDEFTENVDNVTTEGEGKKDEDEKEEDEKGEDEKEEEAAPAEPTLLDKLDADGDGVVSFDEFTENVAEATN